MYTAPHLFPAPPVRGYIAGNQEVKPDLQFSPALPKKGLLSQPFIHVSPSTHHHLVHKFSALLCCLVFCFGFCCFGVFFAAMLGTPLASSNWMSWGYWGALKLACLHPTACCPPWAVKPRCCSAGGCSSLLLSTYPPIAGPEQSLPVEASWSHTWVLSHSSLSCVLRHL